jgi:hypothetical protein
MHQSRNLSRCGGRVACVTAATFAATVFAADIVTRATFAFDLALATSALRTGALLGHATTASVFALTAKTGHLGGFGFVGDFQVSGHISTDGEGCQNSHNGDGGDSH